MDPEQLAGFLLLAVTPADGYALDQQDASEYHLVLADKRKQAILRNQQGCAMQSIVARSPKTTLSKTQVPQHSTSHYC